MELVSTKEEKMRQFLDRVTITGADQGVAAREMARLTYSFPFVEWGILVSKRAPLQRFPSMEWHRELYSEIQRERETMNVPAEPMSLSMHICGAWCRDICRGQWTILESELQFEFFQRLQLNFSPYFNNIVTHDFVQGFKGNLRLVGGKEIIFQIDPEEVSVEKWLDVSAELEALGLKVSVLYDQSGGNGIVPNDWMNPIGEYVGFAGGLTPANVTLNLAKIEGTCLHEQKEPCWIDIETGVRSASDAFDLNAALEFLRKTEPWVIK